MLHVPSTCPRVDSGAIRYRGNDNDSDDGMNRILSVVRSMTDKIIELSRGVVTAPFYGESKRAVGVDQVDTVMLMTRE